MIGSQTCPTSCGVQLLSGEIHYKTPETYFKDVAKLGILRNKHTQYVYTHSEKVYPDLGDKIAQYIHDHSLGVVVKSKSGINPIHDRPITVWVWTRDVPAWERHVKDIQHSEAQSGTATNE